MHAGSYQHNEPILCQSNSTCPNWRNQTHYESTFSQKLAHDPRLGIYMKMVKTNQRPNTEEDIPPLLYRWPNVESQGIHTGSLALSGQCSDTEPEFRLAGKTEITRYCFAHSTCPNTQPATSSFEAASSDSNVIDLCSEGEGE